MRRQVFLRHLEPLVVAGEPRLDVLFDRTVPEAAEDGTPRWQVKLLGLDTFDPVTMQAYHLGGNDVPMRMLDTGWNGMAFKGDQVFFPRTSARDNLRKALKTTHGEARRAAHHDRVDHHCR